MLCHIAPEKEYGQMRNSGISYFNSNTKSLQSTDHLCNLYSLILQNTTQRNHQRT